MTVFFNCQQFTIACKEKLLWYQYKPSHWVSIIFRSVGVGPDHHPAVPTDGRGDGARHRQLHAELHEQTDGHAQVCDGHRRPLPPPVRSPGHHILCLHLPGLGALCRVL